VPISYQIGRPLGLRCEAGGRVSGPVSSRGPDCGLWGIEFTAAASWDPHRKGGGEHRVSFQPVRRDPVAIATLLTGNAATPEEDLAASIR